MSGQESDRYTRVRETAYSLWQDEGRPDGVDHRHWHAAEAIVDSEDTKRKDTEGEPPGDLDASARGGSTVTSAAEVTSSAQVMPPVTRRRKSAATVGGL